MIYLVKKGAKVLAFYDEKTMQNTGFAQADKTVTEAEFNLGGCYARVIDGAIVVGQTEAEKTAAENRKKLDDVKKKLADTDYVVIKIAEGAATKEDYATEITQRQAWRKEAEDLTAALGDGAQTTNITAT
jgi:hypothetical protein